MHCQVNQWELHSLCTKLHNKCYTEILSVSTKFSQADPDAGSGIRIRIGPQYPLLVVMVIKLGWLFTRMQNQNHASEQVWHNKDTSLLKALGAEHRPKISRPSPFMVTSSHERNIIKWDVVR